jgi:hypothetical protein
MVLFQYLMVGYDGVAAVTTLDGRGGVVQVSVLPDFLPETMAILEGLKNELDFECLTA